MRKTPIPENRRRRAAAILDAMVHEGYIGDVDGSSRARPILQKAYDDLQEAEEGREL